MKEQIQADIMTAIETWENSSGIKFLDKFSPLDLGDLAIRIYGLLPLYTDENINIVEDRVVNNYTFNPQRDEDIQLIALTHDYVISQLRILLKVFVNKTYTPELFTALSFWFNFLNKIHFDTKLNNQETEFKDYLLSYIIPTQSKLVEEIEENNIRANTINIGDYFIRLLDEDGKFNFIPTRETIEKYNKFLIK